VARGRGAVRRVDVASARAFLIPVALALLLLRWRNGERSPLDGFFLAVALLYAVGLVWAYWVSPLPLDFHIRNSVGRIYVGVALISLAAIFHLVPSPREPADAAPAAAEPP
jgi:hypothetical protein